MDWSQEKIGVAIGIDESSSRARISRYDLGVQEPPLPTARLIAHARGAPLSYLYDEADQHTGALDIELEVLLLTPCLVALGLPPQRLSIGSARHLYWTVAQLVTHHASNGCNLRPGDLFGSGTISAPAADGFGSLLEITQGGKTPIALASGATRTFLEDGDEVIILARARRDGAATIGFGEVRGVVVGSADAT